MLNPWRVFNYTSPASAPFQDETERKVTSEYAEEIVESQSLRYQHAIGRGLPKAMVEDLCRLAESSSTREIYTKYSEFRFVYEMLSTVHRRDEVLRCVNAWVEVR